VLRSAVEKFETENINPLPFGVSAVAPHVLYQTGAIVHAFPILGNDIGKPSANASVVEFDRPETNVNDRKSTALAAAVAAVGAVC
jgi:hypothetical protein